MDEWMRETLTNHRVLVDSTANHHGVKLSEQETILLAGKLHLLALCGADRALQLHRQTIRTAVEMAYGEAFARDFMRLMPRLLQVMVDILGNQPIEPSTTLWDPTL